LKIKPNQKIATRTHTWRNGKTESSKKKMKEKKKHTSNEMMVEQRLRWQDEDGT